MAVFDRVENGASPDKTMDTQQTRHEVLLAGDVVAKDQLEGCMELKREETCSYQHTSHPMRSKMCYGCRARARSKT